MKNTQTIPFLFVGVAPEAAAASLNDVFWNINDYDKVSWDGKCVWYFVVYVFSDD